MVLIAFGCAVLFAVFFSPEIFFFRRFRWVGLLLLIDKVLGVEIPWFERFGLEAEKTYLLLLGEKRKLILLDWQE